MSTSGRRAAIFLSFWLVAVACAPAAQSPVPSEASDAPAGLFDRVVLVSRHVVPVPGEAVDALQRELGMPLPPGYRAFITRFGEGDYADLFRIYPPERILSGLPAARALWAEQWYPDQQGKLHWFFEGSEHLLRPDEMAHAVLIGDTFDGDELVIHPAHPGRLYLLPRHADLIVTVRADFTDLHTWAGRAEPLVFQAWAHQATHESTFDGFDLDADTLIARAEARWPGGVGDGVLVTYRQVEPSHWAVVLFLPEVGFRFQMVADDGETRTSVDANGTRTTIVGDGRPGGSIQAHGDEEGLAEIEAFIGTLAADGLIRPSAVP